MDTVYWDYNQLILTFDPSTSKGTSKWKTTSRGFSICSAPGSFGFSGNRWATPRDILEALEQCKKPWLFGVYKGITLPSFIGIIFNHYYKDPYEPISIMECHKSFERCSLGWKSQNPTSPDIDPQISQKQFDPLKGKHVQKLKACQFSLGE